MKLIYTHENSMLVSNAKNILENAGISVILKNEYSGGGMGELSPFDTWLELWVVQDDESDQADELIRKTMGEVQIKEWQCSYCFEMNAESFEICWNCQKTH